MVWNKYLLDTEYLSIYFWWSKTESSIDRDRIQINLQYTTSSYVWISTVFFEFQAKVKISVIIKIVTCIFLRLYNFELARAYERSWVKLMHQPADKTAHYPWIMPKEATKYSSGKELRWFDVELHHCIVWYVRRSELNF